MLLLIFVVMYGWVVVVVMVLDGGERKGIEERGRRPASSPKVSLVYDVLLPVVSPWGRQQHQGYEYGK